MIMFILIFKTRNNCVIISLTPQTHFLLFSFLFYATRNLLSQTHQTASWLPVGQQKAQAGDQRGEEREPDTVFSQQALFQATTEILQFLYWRSKLLLDPSPVLQLAPSSRNGTPSLCLFKFRGGKGFLLFLFPGCFPLARSLILPIPLQTVPLLAWLLLPL